HFEGDVLHAVAVDDEAARLGVFGPQRRGEDEGDVALLEDVAGLVAGARLQAGVGDHVEAEGVAVEVRRLAGVADEEADVVDAAQRQRITHCRLSVTHAFSTSLPFWASSSQIWASGFPERSFLRRSISST